MHRSADVWSHALTVAVQGYSPAQLLGIAGYDTAWIGVGLRKNMLLFIIVNEHVGVKHS